MVCFAFFPASTMRLTYLYWSIYLLSHHSTGKKQQPRTMR